jgi:indole-3-glycerol phosphate synthase
MMSVLADILTSTRLELTRRKRARSEAELRDLALDAVGSFAERSLRQALSRPGIGVIAEFKRRSPSAGALRESADLTEIASAYERGGADALSVLTEGPNFDGSLEDLRTAHDACGLPVLRKDFIVDSYQLYEARLAGADAVLLIVAALTPSELRALRELARGLALDVLVEAHDGAELRVALDAGADLIGINNRDLRDFSVDVERTFALLGAIPEGVTVVSESGIGEPEQLARLQDAGVAGVLVGESLMRAPVPEEALRALRTRSRSAGSPIGAKSGVQSFS